MKWLIRLFFRTVRLILGPILLITNALTTPRGIARAPEVQQAVDEQTRQLALYRYKTCPFCLKVNREMKRLSLNIELRDAQHNADSRAELLAGGGKPQVPCLRIAAADGSVQWLYESDAIIDYLRGRFAPVAA